MDAILVLAGLSFSGHLDSKTWAVKDLNVRFGGMMQAWDWECLGYCSASPSPSNQIRAVRPGRLGPGLPSTYPYSYPAIDATPVTYLRWGYGLYSVLYHMWFH